MTTKKPKLPIHKMQKAWKMFIMRYPYWNTEQQPKEIWEDFIYFLESSDD